MYTIEINIGESKYQMELYIVCPGFSDADLIEEQTTPI